MPHLDEGQLTELLDGEMSPGQRDEAEAHLSICGECRQLLEESRGFFQEAGSLIETVQLPLSVPTSSGGPVAVVPPAPQPERRAGERRADARRGPSTWRSLGWAASLVLAVGLGWTASDLRFNGSGAAPASELTTADAASLGATESTPALAQAKEAGRTAANETTPPPAAANAVSTPPARRREEAAARRELAPRAPAATAAEPQALRPGDEERKQSAEADQLGELRAGERAGAAQGATESRDARPSASFVAPPVVAQGGVATYAEPADRRDQAGVRAITLEEAVRQLGGTIRLVDGMVPARVESVASPLAGHTRIRVVYLDPPGRELWLDQDRPVGATGAMKRELADRPAMLPGDTLAFPGQGGRLSLAWMDQAGLRLGLTGFLPADSLRGLARRIR